VRRGREAVAEELKYERSNTQAPNYTISQTPSQDLIFVHSTHLFKLNIIKAVIRRFFSDVFGESEGFLDFR